MSSQSQTAEPMSPGGLDPDSVTRSRARMAWLLIATLIIVTGALTLLGLPAWLVVAIAAVPWIARAARRMPLVIAAVAVLGTHVVAVMAWLWIAPAIGVSGIGVAVSAALASGAGSALVNAWSALPLQKPSKPDMAVMAASSLGGLIWVALMIAARFYPGATTVSWAMAGDSANNVIFAREVLYRGGLEFGGLTNPVPLPSVFASMGMWSARAGVPAADLTAHDVTAYATTWSVLIALSCVVIGLTVGRVALVISQNWCLSSAVAGGASLLGLTWFLTGYPIEYGFFNAHLTFILMAAAWLVYVAGKQSPVPALTALALVSTATLAVWSPLVVIPVSLATAVLVFNFGTVWRSRGFELVIGALGLLQFVGYVVLISVPTYLAQSEALGAPGGAFPFPRPMLVILAAAGALLAGVLAWKGFKHVLWGVLGLGSAVLAALALLLLSSNDPANRWTYYPLKFSWFAGVGLTVVVASLATAVALVLFRRRLLAVLALAAVSVVTVGFVLWTPTAGNGYQAVTPVKRVLQGNYYGDGDALAQSVFELSSLEEAHFLWKTSDPNEGSVNFWLLQIWSDSMSQNLELKYYAYGVYDHEDVASICLIAEAVDAPLTVHTGVPNLESQLQELCPEIPIAVQQEA